MIEDFRFYIERILAPKGTLLSRYFSDGTNTRNEHVILVFDR